MTDPDAGLPRSETIQSGLYCDDGLGAPGAVLGETPDGSPADFGLSGHPPVWKIGGNQPPVDSGDGLGKGLGLVHARDLTAHEFEQSSDQTSGRAAIWLIAQNTLMKMSTADIMETLHTHTRWSWRAIAEFLEVSPNTPQNWLKGGGARGDNLLNAAAKLRLSADQMLGRADIPSGFLDHIDRAKPPRPSRRNGERLYTQSEVDAIVKATLAARAVR